MTEDKKKFPNNIPKIFEKTLVKSYRYGETLEMTTSIGKQTIMVLPGKRYVVLETGEIKDMDVSSESRQDNLKSVKNTMKKLRRLIGHNFHGRKNELWITLTYKEHITDTEKAYNHFKVFIKRMRKAYGKLEYISVIEPQASGRWHYHVLLKKDDESELYIPNKELSLFWGRGFTKTKRLKSSDKVGNYVVAYLSNLKIPEENATEDKKYIKGARLYLYPKGLRIYRCSRNIIQLYEETGIKESILKKNNVNLEKNQIIPK
ncbi:rolling circle replication-associated protein [Salinicoccus carnicancri]|uniref:rolling circle replication-associated protein n=1 Tax=Salinicoccus carnicancri TaxID=558170 RepID=UPI0002F5B93A|nr:hypothetical protein [Salinicoccus carnicancri]